MSAHGSRGPALRSGVALALLAAFVAFAPHISRASARDDCGGPGETRAATGAIEGREIDVDTVRAAFVYKFASRHVKWPDTAFPDKTAPFVVGVLGRDPIHAVLVETFRDRKSGERAIEVRRCDDVESAARCHILFVPASRDEELAAIVKACASKPLLVVATSEAAVTKGAHIGVWFERSKPKLTVDAQAAKKAGLEIGSELLKLARVIDRLEGGGR